MPPKPPKRGGESGTAKMDFLHSYFISLQSGLLMDHINTPISRVSYPNVENPKNQADQFWASLPKIQIYYTTYYIHYILKMPKIDWSGSQDFLHLATNL